VSQNQALFLINLSDRPTLRTYIPALVRDRHLAYSIARNDLRTRHGGLALGWLWNLLDPLLMLGVYWLVFGVLLAGRRPEHFLAFLAVGIFLFRFVQATVESGSNSIRANLDMIRQVRFVRATLPLSEMLRNLLTLYWQFPVVLVIVLVTFGRIRLSWVALLLILVPLASLFAFGGALLFARAGHHLADIQKLLPYAFRILFYASGILFPIDVLMSGNPLQPWLTVNPIYAFVTLARHLALEPLPATGTLWVSVVVWTLASVWSGLILFIRAETRYGRG
jgi:teichoic acid transport system permease protein